MKRSGVFAIAAAVAAGAVGPGGLEAHGTAVHHIDVVLTPAAGGFEVVAPCKDHKVDAASQGDTVEWHFNNRGSSDTAVSIDNFGTPARFKDVKDPRRKATPFNSACDPRGNVPHGGSVLIRCRIRGDHGRLSPNKAITYKYSILGKDGKELLDPEIEIER